MGRMHGYGVQNQHLVDGYGENGDENFKHGMRDLEELQACQS